MTLGVLDGIRIIEVGAIGPVPFAGMLLSDMGADVIRVDRLTPSGLGMPRETRFNITGRGRPSVAVDLKSPEGREVFLELVAKVEALIEGFRPGVMERLGIGPKETLAVNPKLVFGRMTGLGQTGPMSQTVGHDLNYLGLTGALSMIGTKNAAPSIPLNLVADLGGGALYLAVGVLGALLESGKSGKGQVVDCAMIDGITSLLASYYGSSAAGQWVHQRESNVLDGGAPFYGLYETADGRYISIAAIEPKFFSALCDGLEIDLSDMPEQYDREGWPEMRRQFETVFAKKTAAEWDSIMKDREACFGQVLSFEEARHHPHMKSRSVVVESDGVPQPAPAPRFSRTPSAIQGSPSPDGADTDAILNAWGFDTQTRDKFRASGAFGSRK
ncbi:CaiB/BaiF CoA-transferase family protein [Hoeflea sp.]|uniref:CaiB/BaiF CoA transferase family protein n=1 Tax=Hoeflea sp. TaxID=1940281 RepID=UPI0019BAF97E|nr:CaiB/BaiF CoA-transferase family protein [Hoeflea sp.]MBC7283462.1 CoA transferase [Hoeflea sp.]